MTYSDDSALLTIVGSGTLVPSADRGSAAHHLRTDGFGLLLDCGPGALHGFARHGVAWEEISHVAISHFHNDHIGDLVGLLVAFRHGMTEDREEPLVLMGPVGLAGLLDALVALHGDWLRDPGFPVEVRELAPGDRYSDVGRGLEIACHPTEHTDNSLAYRVRGGWGVLVYTGDTGPSDDLADFARGAGVLISECNHADPPQNDHHLSPFGVAAIAERSGPELLIVTHVAPPQSPEEAVARIQERYDGRCIPGCDGLLVRISTDAVTVDLPGRAV